MNEPTDVNYLTKMRGGTLVHAENYHGQLIAIFMRADRTLLAIDNDTFDSPGSFENSGWKEFCWRELETQNLDEAIQIAKGWTLDYYDSTIMRVLLDTSAGGHPADVLAQVKLIVQCNKQDLGAVLSFLRG